MADDELRQPTNLAKFEYLNGMRDYVKNLRMKEKRCLFLLIRNTQGLSPNTFFPHLGITAGHFATFQVLNEHSKKTSANNAAAASKKNKPNVSEHSSSGSSDSDSDSKNEDVDMPPPPPPSPQSQTAPRRLRTRSRLRSATRSDSS